MKHKKCYDHHMKMAEHHKKEAEHHKEHKDKKHHVKKLSMKKKHEKKHHEKVGKKAVNKFKKVMHEFKAGKLHSGSKKGPKVSNPKQAVAIAYSEDRRLRRQHGEKIK